MNITNVYSPKYNEDGSIDVVISTDNILESEIPFTASPKDTELHGRQLYDDLVKGKYGNILPFTEENAISKNLIANRLIVEQHVRSADEIIRTLSEEKEAGIISDKDLERWKLWICYRKNLRELDISSNAIDWPDEPQ